MKKVIIIAGSIIAIAAVAVVGYLSLFGGDTRSADHTTTVPTDVLPGTSGTLPTTAPLAPPPPPALLPADVQEGTVGGTE